MQTCTECKKKTLILFEGNVCSECFVVPEIVIEKKEAEQRTCVNEGCDTLFTPHHYSRIVCSDKCASERLKMLKAKSDKKRKPKKKFETLLCAYRLCDKAFTQEAYNQTLCSPECKKLHTAEYAVKRRQRLRMEK